MKIISVTGAHSSCGKTSLCALLLENLPGFGAIKYSASPLYTSVIDDPSIIGENNKDTAIMSSSGAERVVWVRSSSRELRDALNIAIGKMSGLRGIVVEGNSPSRLMTHCLRVFVIKPDARVKQTAENVMASADIVIVNASEGTTGRPFPGMSVKSGALILEINLHSCTGEIDKFIAHVKKYTGI